jgi:hypothetical protein
MDTLNCSLCGLEFQLKDTACSDCPFAGKGHIACCPRCGYQVIGRSRIFDFIDHMWKAAKQKVRPAG